MEPYEHYLHYLKGFGIQAPGQRVLEHVIWAIGDFHAYSLESDTSGPYKAVASTQGLVAAGRRRDDAWHAFLNAGPALEVANCIAWLETTEEADPHRPGQKLMLVTPDRQPPYPINPAHWALVREPILNRDSNDAIALIAWYAPWGRNELQRWHITAPPSGPAEIEVRLAETLAPETFDPVAEAMRLLTSSAALERQWALMTLGEHKVRAAVSAIEPLLEDADPEVQTASATALATIGDPRVIDKLGQTAAQANDPARRSHLIQVLTWFGDAATDTLGQLAASEASPDIRLEIVHALGQVATPAARTILAQLARDDDDQAVRRLAETYTQIG